MGGMLAATFLAIFFVPVFFRLVMDWDWRHVSTLGRKLRIGKQPK